MMMFVALILLLLNSSGTGQEDDAKFCRDWRKNGDMNQTGMNICAARDAMAAEVEMEKAYQGLLTGVRSLPSDVGGPDQDMRPSIRKIEAAQEAWVHYRDAYIDATFPAEDKQHEYGTMYPMRFSGLREDLAREQTRHLQILCADSVAQWLTSKYCGTP